VKPKIIRNCFRHYRIRTTDVDVTPVSEEPLIDPEVIKDLEEQVQELRYWNLMDIRNFIDYPAEREVAYVLTQEEIVQDLSTNPVPEDEVEANDSQESIPMKATEALSVQVCCNSSGCNKTSSTMRCLLASRQSRTRSAL